MNKLFSFFGHFLRNPKSVGAITELTDYVADSMLEPMRQHIGSEGARILEVGAGMGNISRKILEVMGPDDCLDIVEVDETCCQALRERFAEDKRVEVHCQSVTDWRPKAKYDFIVSTLPFNSFDPSTVRQILQHYQDISQASARLCYVEYAGLHQASLLFSSAEKRQSLTQRRHVLEGFHRQYLETQDLVYLNFLPCHIYHLKWSHSS